MNIVDELSKLIVERLKTKDFELVNLIQIAKWKIEDLQADNEKLKTERNAIINDMKWVNEFNLGFALCNADLWGARNDIKKAQSALTDIINRNSDET